jgi:hypothetical protein
MMQVGSDRLLTESSSSSARAPTPSSPTAPTATTSSPTWKTSPSWAPPPSAWATSWPTSSSATPAPTPPGRRRQRHPRRRRRHRYPLGPGRRRYLPHLQGHRHRHHCRLPTRHRQAGSLDLSTWGFTSLAQVQAKMRQVGSDVAIDLEVDDMVILVGVYSTQITTADLLLGPAGG